MYKPLAIVTGASSGIGAATAEALSTAGHPLLLLARRQELMEGLLLRDCLCVSADLSDRKSLESAVEKGIAAFGEPDILVNNAGIMPLGRIESQDPMEWQRVFDINCVGFLNMTQLVVPGFVERQHGTVVNVGSIAGRGVFGNHMAYCGTKFAVHAMSEQLRRELAPSNVRVVVIAPAIVETELLEGTTSESIKRDYRAYTESIGGGIDVHFVADAIAAACALPQSVCLREVVIAPTRQDA